MTTPDDFNEPKPVPDAKPCPFCGCTTITVEHCIGPNQTFFRRPIWWEVQCTSKKCGVHQSAGTEAEALAKWEHRV